MEKKHIFQITNQIRYIVVSINGGTRNGWFIFMDNPAAKMARGTSILGNFHTDKEPYYVSHSFQIFVPIFLLGFYHLHNWNMIPTTGPQDQEEKGTCW